MRAIGAILMDLDQHPVAPEQSEAITQTQPGETQNAFEEFRRSHAIAHQQVDAKRRQCAADFGPGGIGEIRRRYHHSTVTLLARLRGWSTSLPITTAV